MPSVVFDRSFLSNADVLNVCKTRHLAIMRVFAESCRGDRNSGSLAAKYARDELADLVRTCEIIESDRTTKQALAKAARVIIGRIKTDIDALR
jgi:alpha-D-ribose 1-methylphosphonate 5-triphosphate synthase subunit PhnI